MNDNHLLDTDQYRKLVDSIQKTLSMNIEFALLFGSAVTNRLTDQSDIDIGVYFKQTKIDANEYLSVKHNLESSTGYDIDLIIMNTCDIIIAMQILSNGICIINNNPGLFVLYKAYKISQYIDFKMDRKIIEDNILRGRMYV
jgi:predicted nucleotidyltransferase